MDSLPDGPFLRPHLIEAGYRDEELRALRRRGTLVVVRPGAYVPASDPRLRDPEAHHLMLMRSTIPHLGTGSVMSHASAALLHGLPLWNVPLGRVHITRPREGGGRRSKRLHLHVSRLDPDEVTTVDGIECTSIVRTVADLARSVPFESAVVTADAALHAGSVSAAELAEAVARSAHRRGNTAAGRVVMFADGRSESVGESRSRVVMRRYGIPAPVLQYDVRSANGRLLGRSDFGWPDLNTVGEFDGQVKYGRLLRPGETPGDAVFREKRREDLIRDAGPRVARWVWDELDAFDAAAGRLRRAFRASRPTE